MKFLDKLIVPRPARSRSESSQAEAIISSEGVRLKHQVVHFTVLLTLVIQFDNYLGIFYNNTNQVTRSLQHLGSNGLYWDWYGMQLSNR